MTNTQQFRAPVITQLYVVDSGVMDVLFPWVAFSVLPSVGDEIDLTLKKDPMVKLTVTHVTHRALEVRPGQIDLNGDSVDVTLTCQYR